MERRQGAAALGLVAVTLFFSSCGYSNRSPIQPAAAATATSREFAVSGGVSDSAYRPLGESRVEVVGGPRAGTVVTTDQAGRFSIPGTFIDTVTLKASKEGYVSITRQLPPPFAAERLPPPSQDTGSWETYFQLEPAAPSANFTGEYTLTVAADRACKVPDEAKTRTYTATVTGDARTRFRGTLSGARFFSTMSSCPAQFPELCTHNRFWISTAGNYASIYLGFVEQLGDAIYLVVSAGSEGTFDSEEIITPVSGSFLYCPREPYLIDQGTWACPADGVECESSNHQFRLVRR